MFGVGTAKLVFTRELCQFFATPELGSEAAYRIYDSAPTDYIRRLL
jgi:hypothetical protein